MSLLSKIEILSVALDILRVEGEADRLLAKAKLRHDPQAEVKLLKDEVRLAINQRWPKR